MNKIQHMVSQLKRNVDTKSVRRKYIVSFEDAKSAPSYFESFLKEENINQNQFVIRKCAEGSDPMSVIDSAIRAEDKLKKDEGFSRDEDDEVWIVVDVDQHSNLSHAIERCRQKQYDLALSNPCFEYWVLLHFVEAAPGVKNCSEMISNHLKKHMPEYSKSGEAYKAVVPDARIAAQRAERQHKAKLLDCPSRLCPSTTFYKLINSVLDQ